MKKYILLFLFLNIAFATESPSLIVKMMMDTDLPKVFIKLDKKYNNPSCHKSTDWDYVADLKFASFLTVGMQAHFTGRGKCRDYPKVESLKKVEVLYMPKPNIMLK